MAAIIAKITEAATARYLAIRGGLPPATSAPMDGALLGLSLPGR
jgi:hypothetical protein